EGMRIHFRLMKGDISEKPIKLEPEFGVTRDIVRSPDLRSLSVLWVKGEGLLKATFPYGQEAEFEWDGETLVDSFLYVLYEEHGVRVTTRVMRGAPMVPRILARVTADEDAMPVTLQWEGRETRTVTRSGSIILFELPGGRQGKLESGDWNVKVSSAKGASRFSVGVDPDGTLTASTGYVRRKRG
ncbi:MAG: hypothetical protein AAGD14_18785, partial [Planctomycetota bacterium]